MLCALAEKYRVDKCPAILHSYTPEYHRILEANRDSVKLVVEIGIGNPELMRPIAGAAYQPGASLRMWRDYFPGAKIIGCDIRKDVFFQEERINCRMVDQSDENSLRELRASILGSYPEGADLILDDGSHVKEHMMLSFKVLWDAVKVGGFYIIEDIRNSDLLEFMQLHRAFRDCSIVTMHMGRNNWDSFVCFRRV